MTFHVCFLRVIFWRRAIYCSLALELLRVEHWRVYRLAQGHRWPHQVYWFFPLMFGCLRVPCPAWEFSILSGWLYGQWIFISFGWGLQRVETSFCWWCRLIGGSRWGLLYIVARTWAGCRTAGGRTQRAPSHRYSGNTQSGTGWCAVRSSLSRHLRGYKCYEAIRWNSSSQPDKSFSEPAWSPAWRSSSSTPSTSNPVDSHSQNQYHASSAKLF